jgi:hypothetical protein
MESYNFAPLNYHNSIRLINLLPWEKPTDIKIALFEARFDDKTSYDALPYTRVHHPSPSTTQPK